MRKIILVAALLIGAIQPVNAFNLFDMTEEQDAAFLAGALLQLEQKCPAYEINKNIPEIHGLPRTPEYVEAEAFGKAFYAQYTGEIEKEKPHMLPAFCNTVASGMHKDNGSYKRFNVSTWMIRRRR